MIPAMGNHPATRLRTLGKVHHYILYGLLLAGVFVAGVVITSRPKAVPTIPPATRAATLPTTAPATKPAAVVRTFVDVVRANYPKFPATQPLDWPTTLEEAARVVINDPVYVERPSLRGDLWITRPDAPQDISEVLKAAFDDQVHVLRDAVVFSHWTADDTGKLHPNIVVRKVDGSYSLLNETDGRELSKADYEWDRARGVGEIVAVPVGAGVSVIPLRANAEPATLHFYATGEVPANASSPEILEDAGGGLLAWMPWENGKTGSRGAARYLDGKWTKLDSSSNWPAKIAQLVPLKDGGVVQLVASDDGSLKVALAMLGPAQKLPQQATVLIDENEIEKLIDQLSAPEQTTRDAAFAELSRFGAASYAILEKLLPAQSPAAQVRIKALLKSNLTPTLGGMTPLPGPIQTVARNADGTAVFYLDAGVTLPGPQGEPQPTAPAWLALRPGRAAKLLSDFFTQDMQPGKQSIVACGDEWIISDDAQGPRRFMENHYQPMLKKKEKQFSRFIGFDRKGRWIFKPEKSDTPTLIIDPTLPDLRPRLPVWIYPVKDGKVGWTRENWPVIDKGGAWVLIDKGWRPLDEKKEKMITEVSQSPEAPAGSEIPSTNPTTAPTTLASSITQPATTQPLSPPILTDADGTKYYDGLETIRVVTKDGKTQTWPLPATANGSGDVWFFHAGEDRFFLFNEPGRVLRLKRTAAGPEPFVLEATFAKNIPSSDVAARIWLDPAGRIVIAHDGDTLTILFPSGQVPPEMAKLMPNLGEDEE